MTEPTKATTPELPTKTWEIVARFNKYDDARIYGLMELPDEFVKGTDYKIKYIRKTRRYSVRTVVVASQEKKQKNKK